MSIDRLPTDLANPLLDTDSYKTSHFLQYPPGTTTISSYIEARSGDLPDVAFFGLQAFLLESLSKPFTAQQISEAAFLFRAHGVPFNQAGWQHILTRHDGYLPVRIDAVAEGSVLPKQKVLLQIHNTDPQCPWLTSYLEPALLRAVWYPTTVASLSHACRQIIRKALIQTADNLDGLPFKLHDFGARGVSSRESAALGGLGHLVNFMGSDTVSALVGAARWYGMDTPEKIAGYSIPAAEHSTITAWGRDNEVDAYRNMLQQFAKPKQIVAVVSDSYDLWNAIDHLWGEILKADIEHSGGTLVIRPDSGDPVKVVREALERLAVRFGYTLNSKGYKLLPPYVRLIQGDGINLASLGEILDAITQAGFSADNVAFGMGGGLLQQVNRDTLGFAMKASAAEVNGVWRDVYKDPITSQAKRSKRGKLALVQDAHGYHTIRQAELGDQVNLLQPVFEDGQILRQDDLTTIRQRAGW